MTSDAAAAPDASVHRPSRRFIWITFTLFLLGQLFAYAQAFKVRPASDDWPIINEVHRGNQQGVGVFFTDSVIRIGYRPLKSLAIWFFGNLSQDEAARFAWIRVLHLTGAVCYALVAVAWLRALPIGLAGAGAVILLMFLHPVLAAPVGSIDGIDTLMSSTLLWLGAWCCWRFRSRLLTATITTAACFVVGVGFKENLFALVPLAVVVVMLFWPRERRMIGCACVGGTLAILAAAAILVRRFVIRGGLEAGANMLDFSPRQLAENVALFASGLLFFGNTVWVYVHQSAAVLAMVGGSCLTVLALVTTGLGRKIAPVPIYFPMLGLMIAAFPTILLYHVSEMYVAPMLLPFAMIVALAVDGLCASRAGRVIASVVAAVVVMSSVLTIRSKVAGLVDVGERADRQLRQVLEFVPPGTKGTKILLRFDPNDLPPRRTYSVFRMGDEILLVHRQTPEWLRQGDGIELQSDRFDLFDPKDFDIVLKWDAKQQKFDRIK